MTFYIDTRNHDSSKEIAYLLKKCIRHHRKKWSEMVFLCIGSDRMTGDCLGPYIGHRLSSAAATLASGGIYVYGTLRNPVHALNLPKIQEQISRLHPDALVIAIDASLGEKKHLGYVTIENGALRPGAGVSKNLPPAGDISITGIVNIAGFLEQMTLQTTRLSTVIALADTITTGILDIFPVQAITQTL